MPQKIVSVEDLNSYQEAFRLQQAVFRLTKTWPREELYSLIDQIRRSSRSIGANLSEAWAKRRYPAHFESKLTDADAELQETLHWLKTASGCCYLSDSEHESLRLAYLGLGQMLGAMFIKAGSFTL
jgi:four helix bundle protein